MAAKLRNPASTEGAGLDGSTQSLDYGYGDDPKFPVDQPTSPTLPGYPQPPTPTPPMPTKPGGIEKPVDPGGPMTNVNVGHDGSYNGQNREQWRDEFMGQGSMSTGDMTNWLKQHGATQLSGNGTFQTPFGENLDLEIGARSGQAQPGWTQTGSVGGPQTNTGSGAYGSGGNGTQSWDGSEDNLKSILSGLFPGGAFNQDLVNSRTQGAREDLQRFQKSQSANDNSVLAARGLLGDGAQQTAQNRLSSDIADKYSGAVQGIWGDETQAADQRMMQSLSLATGMSMADAQNAIEMFKANNDYALGQGQLALGNYSAQTGYDLGLRNDDLQRADLENRARQGDIAAQIELLRIRTQTGLGTAGGRQS